ncbi:MAG: Dipeptidyl aminopeptidase, partial [Planctomycetota bacterium]
MRKFWISFLIYGLCHMSITESAKAQTGPRAMTVEDLLSVKSVGGLKLSPNGQTVAYSVSMIDKKTGKSNSDIWLLDLGRGAEPKQLTTSAASDSEPAWTPDGKSIVFVSRRSGSAQIWQISVDGGEAR